MPDVRHHGTGWSLVVPSTPPSSRPAIIRLSRWHSGPPRFASRGWLKPSRAPIRLAARDQDGTTVPGGNETVEDSGQTSVGTDSDGHTYSSCRKPVRLIEPSPPPKACRMIPISA